MERNGEDHLPFLIPYKTIPFERVYSIFDENVCFSILMHIFTIYSFWGWACIFLFLEKYRVTQSSLRSTSSYVHTYISSWWKIQTTFLLIRKLSSETTTNVTTRLGVKKTNRVNIFLFLSESVLYAPDPQVYIYFHSDRNLEIRGNWNVCEKRYSFVLQLYMYVEDLRKRNIYVLVCINVERYWNIYIRIC